MRKHKCHLSAGQCSGMSLLSWQPKSLANTVGNQVSIQWATVALNPPSLKNVSQLANTQSVICESALFLSHTHRQSTIFTLPCKIWKLRINSIWLTRNTDELDNWMSVSVCIVRWKSNVIKIQSDIYLDSLYVIHGISNYNASYSQQKIAY